MDQLIVTSEYRTLTQIVSLELKERCRLSKTNGINKGIDISGVQ